MPGSAKMAALGFMIFGCGCEMAGTTVSKAIAKWFKGKEMALAMGLEMAIARLGVFAVMWLSPAISDKFGGSVTAAHALFEESMYEGLKDFAYPNSIKRLKIFFSTLEHPGLFGAASLCYGK